MNESHPTFCCTRIFKLEKTQFLLHSFAPRLQCTRECSSGQCHDKKTSITDVSPFPIVITLGTRAPFCHSYFVGSIPRLYAKKCSCVQNVYIPVQAGKGEFVARKSKNTTAKVPATKNEWSDQFLRAKRTATHSRLPLPPCAPAMVGKSLESLD